MVLQQFQLRFSLLTQVQTVDREHLGAKPERLCCVMFFILNICYLQSGFPSQFYLALPRRCKHTGLMQPLIGLCEIIACLRKKWDCLKVVYRGFAVCIACCGLTQKKGKKMLIKVKCLQSTACKPLPPGSLLSQVFSHLGLYREDELEWQRLTELYTPCT